MFYTTGNLPISDENWKAVQDWVSSGKGGFIGIHSSTDTQWDYKGEGMSYTRFINGQFNGHPWGQGTPLHYASLDPMHPTVKMWGEGFDYKEETYQYKHFDPTAVRVLQVIDMEHTSLKMPYLVPLTWVREIGKGRLFYSNLGHTPSTWEDPKFREMIVEATKWVTHQIDGSAVPNPEVQALWTIGSFVAYGDSGKGPRKEGLTESAVIAKLHDGAWNLEMAGKINKIRDNVPGDMQPPHEPKKADEAKDPAKFKDAMTKYEKELASYNERLPAHKEAVAKYEAERKGLLAEIAKKAESPTASAK